MVNSMELYPFMKGFAYGCKLMDFNSVSLESDPQYKDLSIKGTHHLDHHLTSTGFFKIIQTLSGPLSPSSRKLANGVISMIEGFEEDKKAALDHLQSL